jgi:hypothetical protein
MQTSLIFFLIAVVQVAVAAPVSALQAAVEAPASALAETDSLPHGLETDLWSAAALHRLVEERDYHAVLLIAAVGAITREGRQPADLALDEARSLIERARDQRDRALAGFVPEGARASLACSGLQDTVDGLLCALEQLAPQASTSLARGLTAEGSRLVSDLVAARDSVARGLEREVRESSAAALTPFYRLASEAVDDLRLLRSGFEGLPEAGRSQLDLLVSELTGLAPDASGRELLSGLPGLDDLLRRHPLPAAGLEMTASLDQVVGEYRSFLERARTPLAAGPEGLFNEAAERAWVYLASLSADQAGAAPELIGRIRTLGNAAVELRQTSSFLSLGLSAGREAASLALGGNALGVAMGITAFFAGHPGAFGPGAADEVRILREGMEATRVEMGERFDVVDARLDEILGRVTTRFDRLEELVAVENARTRGEVLALHREISGFGERVDRLEETLLSYVEAGFDRDFNRTLIVCLEHRERHLPPFDQMEFGVFAGCLADFRARAERDARDALLTDRATSVDDAALAAALADPSLRNLGRRLPLLERVAAERFGYAGMRGSRELANPIEWAMASEAYLTMLQDWPEHAASVSAGDLEAIRAAGVDVRDAIRAITVGPGNGADGALLQEVLAYHRAAATRLTSEADILARRYQQAELRRVPRSAIADRVYPPTEGEYPVLAVPGVIAAGVPSEVRTAGVLALGEARLRYDLSFEERQERDGFRRRWLIFGKRHDRTTWTRTSMAIELSFGAEGSLSTWRTTGPWVLTSVEEMSGGEESENVRSLERRVADPGQHFLREYWPAARDGDELWTGSAVPPAVLARLEVAIEAELRRHASQALDDVFRAVCSAEDDPALTTGADRTSVLAMREALRGMTASRALLRGYVGLGLPQVLDGEGDGELRDLLFGEEAILDETALCGAVEAGESPLRLVWLDEVPLRRAAAADDALSAALEDIPAEMRGFPMVESTLERIEAAARLQRVRADLARRGS